MTTVDVTVHSSWDKGIPPTVIGQDGRVPKKRQGGLNGCLLIIDLSHHEVASLTVKSADKVPIKAYKNKSPFVGKNVFIDETAMVVGDVTLGDDSSIWPMCVLRGDVNHIEIGSRTNIQDGSVLHVTHPNEHSPDGYALFVGNDVTVGHRVVLHGCRIGNFCLIGIGAIVMDGAVIEDEVILGAGSLVPPGRTLETGFLYLGSPARKARPLIKEEKIFFRYSAKHYLTLKDDYLQRFQPPIIP